VPYFGWSHPGNSTAYAFQAGVFLCPSNRAAGEVGSTVGSSSLAWEVPRAAVTDYLFNSGANRYVVTGFGETDRLGPFGFDTATRLAQVRDGASNTFFIGEAAGGNLRNRFRAVGAGSNRVCVALNTPLPGISATQIFYDNIMYMAYGRSRTWGPDRRILGGLAARTVDHAGAASRPNDCAYDSITDLFDPPPGRPAPALGQQLPNFRSAHPGLTLFLFGDGSVRPIKDSLAAEVYQGLSTMAGGEVLSADAY
jgi:hypothetical protein